MAELRKETIIQCIRKYNEKDFGNQVWTLDGISEDIARTISAICRRRCKPQDVLAVIDVDEDDNGDTSIVFTLSSIFYLEGTSNPSIEIAYNDIICVDFGEENVYLTTSDSTITLWCGEDSEEYRYPMMIYSLISDILEERDS